jgi:hypothetical protein
LESKGDLKVNNMVPKKKKIVFQPGNIEILVEPGANLREAALRFPHTRGGEPEAAEAAESAGAVFPTRVGVNRSTVNAVPVTIEFSPHAWG